MQPNRIIILNLKHGSLIVLLLLAMASMAQGIIIPPGAYVVSGNGNIVISKNFTNNGSFTHNSGSVVFAGSTQSLAGTTATAFYNLTTLTGSTTTIASAGHSVNNVLLSNGTLNANGNLTLISTAAGTAAVDGSGTGEVLGNLIVQRYLSSGFGYKYFSSPFQSDTVGDFANDMNLSATFPTFYKHDESLASNGWVTYTNGSGVLSPMRGYAANLGASSAAKTVDLKGVVNNHSLSRALYNNNMAFTQGFNLVGNPYPSPVDWDAASGWTKTNIDNAVYFFNAGTTDQYTGVYSSYINGVSSDGIAGNTIAAMQGFFVHVSNGGYPVAGLLGINNNARTLNRTANFFRVAGSQRVQPLIRLTASLTAAATDAVTFYFSDDATAKFNKTLDALKLLNTDSLVPNLFAVSKDAQKLSINAVKALDTFTTVPLGLITKKAGGISFNATDIKSLPAGMYVYFIDKAAGVHQDMQKEPTYRIMLPAGDYENRFFLQLSTKDPVVLPTANTGIFGAYSRGGRLFVNAQLGAGEKGTITVVNMAGQTICRQAIMGNTYQPMQVSFASGAYIIHLSGESKDQSKKIFIGDR